MKVLFIWGWCKIFTNPKSLKNLVIKRSWIWCREDSTSQWNNLTTNYHPNKANVVGDELKLSQKPKANLATLLINQKHILKEFWRLQIEAGLSAPSTFMKKLKACRVKTPNCRGSRVRCKQIRIVNWWTWGFEIVNRLCVPNDSGNRWDILKEA